MRLVLLALLCSCINLLELTGEQTNATIDLSSKSDQLKIFFSHNINGELEPCGCRNHPLGGIAQLYGLTHSEKSPFLFVATGDTFFNNSVVPQGLEKSWLATATELAQLLEKSRLAFIVPGDQDFSMGVETYNNLVKNRKFKTIISNKSEDSKINAIPYQVIKFANQHITLLGIVEPSIMGQYASNFTDPFAAIKDTRAKLKKQGIDQTRIIVLSHSGVDFDKQMANVLPKGSWILGSHTQSFLRQPTVVNGVSIGQVLSRNHYIGEVALKAGTQTANYKIIELRDEYKDKVVSNPMLSSVEKFKKQLDQIQLEEQVANSSSSGIKKHATYQSCQDCHAQQTEFWQGTAHSLAYLTLDKANSANNPQCIGCHSLGNKQPQGFNSKKDMIISKKDHSAYWREFVGGIKTDKVIRDLSATERKKISSQWMKLDEKFELEHNFANVQCLNCHSLHDDHPFSLKSAPSQQYTKKCLACHTPDQSPEWYKDSGADPQKLKQALKKVACPKS